MVFYVSKNKVILSSGFEQVIPTKYFKRVTDNKGNLLYTGDSCKSVFNILSITEGRKLMKQEIYELNKLVISSQMVNKFVFHEYDVKIIYFNQNFF